MLHAHATRSVTISDVMAGVMVEFGAEETGSSLARTSAIPAETHDIKQEVFQFRSVVRGDQHHMTRTPFVGKETTVRTARLERARQPFLPVKQFVLIPHRVTKTHQFTHATLFAQFGITAGVVDIGRRQLLDTVLERHAPHRFPADVDNSVHLAWVESKAMAAIIDLEVQRIGITLGVLADAKPHHLRAILTPRFEIWGLKAHVT